MAKQLFLFARHSWAISLHSDFKRFGRVVPENVDHFDDDLIFSRLLVLVLRLQVNLGFFACPVGLPLIVKCIVLIVPIHSPIVDQLTPVLDGFSRFFWDVVRRNHKILEPDGQFACLYVSVPPIAHQAQKIARRPAQ